MNFVKTTVLGGVVFLVPVVIIVLVLAATRRVSAWRSKETAMVTSRSISPAGSGR